MFQRQDSVLHIHVVRKCEDPSSYLRLTGAVAVFRITPSSLAFIESK